MGFGQPPHQAVFIIRKRNITNPISSKYLFDETISLGINSGFFLLKALYI